MIAGQEPQNEERIILRSKRNKRPKLRKKGKAKKAITPKKEKSCC